MSAKVQTYADLQKMIRKALREQHPDWVDANGKCTLCDWYEARLAYLLDVFASARTLRVPLTSTSRRIADADFSSDQTGLFPQLTAEGKSNDHDAKNQHQPAVGNDCVDQANRNSQHAD
jgi:hypothetical protein